MVQSGGVVRVRGPAGPVLLREPHGGPADQADRQPYEIFPRVSVVLSAVARGLGKTF